MAEHREATHGIRLTSTSGRHTTKSRGQVDRHIRSTACSSTISHGAS